MKIAIDKKPVAANKAWGGGNVWLSSLYELLEEKGWTIQHHIQNADILYINDARVSNPMISYAKRSSIPIVMRFGDLCYHSKNHMRTQLFQNACEADLQIFPSEWARDQLQAAGDALLKPSKVILNQPGKEFSPRKPIKLVTHHWSTNPMKGKEFYEQLDELIPQWGFEFTFIGRTCFIPKNTQVIGPLLKNQLASVLPNFDYYLTASQLEAGANHVLEAMACNLPVLYHKEGGSIPEYCRGAGIEWEEINDLRPILDCHYFSGVRAACLEMHSALKLALVASCPNLFTTEL